MTRLHDLPDDILITIFTHCDVDSIFAARLTCVAFPSVISTYINTIAPKAARNTFPGCEVLLTPPNQGYSLKWLRSRIPEQLASVILDKNKLRRSPHINSGFPYGIPSESDCAEAKHWRACVANGWRILSSLYMISKEVEAIILEKRLAFIERLSSLDPLNYVYLWRLLLWVFRPYKRPDAREGSVEEDCPQDLNDSPPSRTSTINDISQGWSWLNWYILHVGPSPFVQQWSIPSSRATSSSQNLIRDLIWKARSARSPHQIEVEREYICKFELAPRKRCLPLKRLIHLEAELNGGRNIRTISLDCIPWIYDQHYTIARPETGFPWHKDQLWIWMNGDYHLRLRGIGEPRLWSTPQRLAAFGPDDDEKIETAKGPLAKVLYLVYLGTDQATRVWQGATQSAAEFAF
ncbi:hypothetical protein EK21DRAFT_109446 [Setomelanomma holmii]|uniref:F-box domain-containing protein n=1 Tax=Setomelanomma holmii TaxID=210430 RepID=A0A9P4HE77_9PLEO|nr:hypothetical protein EK21DRAFT_109446 [Setomelanomma holmii]